MTDEPRIVDLRNYFLSIQYPSPNIKACQDGNQSYPDGIVCEVLANADTPTESERELPRVLFYDIFIRVGAVPIRVESEWVWINIRVVKHCPTSAQPVKKLL